MIDVQLSPEVAAALADQRAIVALESTIFSHLGLPSPANREALTRCLAAVRTVGAVPAVTAVLDGVARAFYWQHLLDTGAMQSGSAIARAEKLHHSVVNELLRLTLLAPDIIEQFMAGKQPRRLTLMWFQRNRLMVDWHAQRQLMASFEEDV